MSLLVFDSHPVQYRVPVWKQMHRNAPGSVQVVYASDCSVRGHLDVGFGRSLAWDEPMLKGYPNVILNCEKGQPLAGWSSLTGAGVAAVLERHSPSAVLLTGMNYRFDLTAYRETRKRGIPVWLRCETQDEAVHRPPVKALVRSLIYRLVYPGFTRIFYIGALNRAHYLKHGVPEEKLRSARYCTQDRFIALAEPEKGRLRVNARKEAGVPEEAVVVGFSGKLIPKKDPGILFDMLEHLPESLRGRIWLYFLGSGELEASLRTLAAERDLLRKVVFAGFVNQSKLAAHYLAMDLMVLPSKRMGETWGLVANEAMQAGCSVIVSDAVGSKADFAGWSRFRVFPVGDAVALAAQVAELSVLPRSFDWAAGGLENYSIEATAQAFLGELVLLSVKGEG